MPRIVKGHAERTELLRIGQMLSNWAYNMSQSKELSEQRRDELRELYKQWDEAWGKFRKLYRAAQPKEQP